MTSPVPRKQRVDAIRANLRLPLVRLRAELRRVEADLHSVNGIDRHGRGSARLRVRRLSIRTKLAWRSILAALVPRPAARFQVTLRPARGSSDGAAGQLTRPLRLASCLLPRGSRDRWTEEWRGELAVLHGYRRFRWTLSTLRGLIPQARILRRPRAPQTGIPRRS